MPGVGFAAPHELMLAHADRSRKHRGDAPSRHVVHAEIELAGLSLFFRAVGVPRIRNGKFDDGAPADGIRVTAAQLEAFGIDSDIARI